MKYTVSIRCTISSYHMSDLYSLHKESFKKKKKKMVCIQRHVWAHLAQVSCHVMCHDSILSHRKQRGKDRGRSKKLSRSLTFIASPLVLTNRGRGATTVLPPFTHRLFFSAPRCQASRRFSLAVAPVILQPLSISSPCGDPVNSSDCRVHH